MSSLAPSSVRRIASLLSLVALGCGDDASPPDADAGPPVDAADPRDGSAPADAAEPRDGSLPGCVTAEGVEGCVAHGAVVTLRGEGLGEKRNPEVDGEEDAVPSIWMMGDDLRFNGVPSPYHSTLADGANVDCHEQPFNYCETPESPWGGASGVTMQRTDLRHSRVASHFHLDAPGVSDRHSLGGGFGDPLPLRGHSTPLDRGVLAWQARWTHAPVAYRRVVVSLSAGTLGDLVPSGDWPHVSGEPIRFPDSAGSDGVVPSGRLLSVDVATGVVSFVFDDDSPLMNSTALMGGRFVTDSGVEGVVSGIEWAGTSHKLFRTHHPRLPGIGRPEPGLSFIWNGDVKLLVSVMGRNFDEGGDYGELVRIGTTGLTQHTPKHADAISGRIPRDLWQRYEAFVDRHEATMIRTFLQGRAIIDAAPLDEMASNFRVTATEPALRGGVVVESGEPFRESFTIGRLGIDVSGAPHREVFADLGELYFDRTSDLNLVIAETASGREGEVAYQLPLVWRDGELRFEVNAGAHDDLRGKWLLLRDGVEVRRALPLN